MPQTLTDLGRAVKSKYAGQYDDLPDDELGRRIKEKFPGAYDDYAEAPAVAQRPAIVPTARPTPTPVAQPLAAPAAATPPATAPTARPNFVGPPAPAQPLAAPATQMSAPAQPQPPQQRQTVPGLAITPPAVAVQQAQQTAQGIVNAAFAPQTISAQPAPGFFGRLAAPFTGPGSAYGNIQAQREGARIPYNPDAPLVDLGANRKYITGGAVNKGFTTAAQDFLSGFTTPKSIALLLATGGLGGAGKLSELSEPAVNAVAKAGAKWMPAIRRLVSGGFALDMIRGALEQSPQLIKQIKAGDTEGATHTLTTMAASLGMGGAAGAHALEGTPEAIRRAAPHVEKALNRVSEFSQTGDSDTGITAPTAPPETTTAAPKPKRAKKPKPAPEPEYTITGQPVRKPEPAQPHVAEREPPAATVETKPPEPETKEPEHETKKPESTASASVPARPEHKPEPHVEPERGGGHEPAPARAPTGEPAEPPAETTGVSAPPAGVEEEIGPHGPVLRNFHHDAAGAIAELQRRQSGEAIGALHHPQVGDIDLIWGGKTYGLAKISERHPDVLSDLQGILDRLHEVSRNENTILLNGNGYSAVIRRNWKGDPKTWLLTAFGKTREGEGPSAGRTIDVSDTHATERQAPPPGGSDTSVTPEPAKQPKKPVTPQVANEPGTKYVLPTFATGGRRGAAPEPKAETETPAPADEKGRGATDKSVEHFTATATVAKGTVTMYLRHRKMPVIRTTFPLKEWPNPTIGNPLAPQRRYIERHLTEKTDLAGALNDIKGDESINDGTFNRLVDSMHGAVTRAIGLVKPAASGRPGKGVMAGLWKGETPTQPHEAPAAPPAATVETPAVTPAEVESERGDAEGTDLVRDADTGSLEPVPAGSGEGTGGAGQAPEGIAIHGGPGGGSVRGPGGSGAVSGPGEGNDAGNVDGPTASAPRPPRPARSADTRPRLTGYRITSSDHLGEGSLADKAIANIEAIRTMKHVEAEGRPATADEQKKLVRYTGWGALSEVFAHYQSTAAMRQVRADLQNLLTTDEWRTAAATTPNAHYTSETVINGLWNAVKRLGVKPGMSVLEPSVGAGHFFGLMPDELQTDAKLAGVELDPVTARIAALLYPNAGIYPIGFERTKFPNNWFDLAISNVPFGNYPVFDPAFKGARRGLTTNIHNFFFSKAMDKVRPGGIIAFVTSHYTMDSRDSFVREHLQREAKFLGAIRLPQTAFEKNAGTTVVTDIVFLQKRLAGDASEAEDWIRASPTDLFPGDEDNPYLNDYYRRHPEMILGTVKGNRGRFGPELNVLGTVTPEALAGAVARLPENVYTDRPAPEALNPNAIAAAEYPAAGHLKQNAYGLIDGKIMQKTGEMLAPVSFSKDATARVTAMIHVRDAMHEVYRSQLQQQTDAEIEAARKALNRVYDGFVKKFGYLNDKTNSKLFQGDPDAQPLLALEKWDKKAKTAKKTEVFTQPTIQTYKPVASADTAAEALAISLNEYGRINWGRMAQLTGQDAAALQEELGPLAFQDPESREWLPADEYLSGDIRQKLAQAQDIAKSDPAYARNVAALEAAKPPDLKGGTEIVARLGSPWIPAKVVERFVAELLGVHAAGVSASYSAPIATWRIVLSAGKDSVANKSTWAGGGVWAHELIEQALNMKIPTVRVPVGDEGQTKVEPRLTAAAQDKQQKIKDRFKNWVWEDPTRAKALEKLYNDTYNGIRLREYDGSHLNFAGSNPGITLKPHQKNAVWRILSSGMNTLLAHVVGAGKTFEMVAAAMELRRLGLAKKPLITVPSNIVGQFGREFKQLYPAANIFVADEKTFEKKNRQKAMAQIANGNYDAAIISHDAFGLIPVADETFNAFLQKEIDALEDAILEVKAGKADKKIQKELEKAKKRLEAKLRKAADTERKDTGLTFEQMGIDALFVDEADLFKNLFFVTRATRIAGIPNTASNRAFDMLIKSRFTTDKTGGRLVFATGTPIANTVAEMYTMLRYLAPKELESRNISMFDAWALQFGESVTGQEVSPDGAGFRTNTRFAKFTNLPELQSLFRLVADVQTADMLNLPVPKLKGGKYETQIIEASQILKDYIMGKDEKGNYLPGTLMHRIARIKGGQVDPREDNMLKVTSDGRKAALDLRLVGIRLSAERTKVNTVANRIFEIWEEGKKERTTQLVFSDLSTPSRDRWNVYDEIRRQLTMKGVPADEIAFAHDFDTEAKKSDMQERVNAGEIRVLIGSTGKMGAGTNVQKRLIALHHLDVPWRPRDVEQREGRIIRQGNTNEEVHIIRYVTAPSFDAYMWGMVARKAKFINQVMTGRLGVREAEDISQDALGAAEAEAAATGNPLIKEKAEVDAEVYRLSALEAEHTRMRQEARSNAQSLAQTVEREKAVIPKLEADIAIRDQNTPKNADDWSMTVDGKKYTERKKAGEALIQFAKDNRLNDQYLSAGTYRGFELQTQGHGAEKIITNDSGLTEDTNAPTLRFQGDYIHFAKLNPMSALGTMQSLEHAVNGLDHELENAHGYVTRYEKDRKDSARNADTPFPEGATLDGLVKRQAEIGRLLDLGSNAAVIDEPEGGEEAAPEAEGAEPADEATASALDSAPPKLGPEAGVASLDLVTLGLASFVKEDVVPAVRDAALGLIETMGDIRRTVTPTLFDRNAELGSLVLRGKLAELARKGDRAAAALAKAVAYFEHRPRAENYEFIDRMERGLPQASADLDKIAFVLRRMLDDSKADVQSLGTGRLKTFYTNYFPHIWENPRRAAQVFQAFFGRRPFEGGKAFLKRRKLPKFSDGLARGLKPVTDNPASLVILKTHEMARYVMAHETLAEWKKRGLAKFFRGNRPPPKGWTRIDDSISTVYGRNAAGETIVRGHYYAPDGAALVMNNYLSPGLRQYAAYRGVTGLNNVLNQFQLGMSAFHLGFTAADTTVSKMALAYQALLRGHPVKAAKFAAQTPTAAFTTFFEGNKLLREWYRPGSQGALMGALADALERSGGRARMQQEYRTEMASKMRAALRKGNIWGAAARVPFAGVEAVSNLIMNEIVPRMKLGAFADLARFHMETMDPNASYDEQSRVFAQDWDSIENRLGEMTYDNLFWNRIAKDLAHISVRSVGWNLGTLRETGGGIADIAYQPYRALKGEPVNLNRLSYLLGLVTVNAVMSAVYQYAKTGKPPDELEDYFFPKNGELDEAGRPQRVSWPTYIKDIYHYGTHPLRTIGNKAAPVWSALSEMIRNRDFYGDAIRNPDDPLVKQLLDSAKHAVGDFTPIAVRNYLRETTLGGSPATRAEQFVGINAAPAELNQTAAERMASEMSASYAEEEKARTPQASARRTIRQSYTRSLRGNKPIPKEVLEAYRAGKMTAQDVKTARLNASRTPLQRAFAGLSIEDALKVFRVATAAEKRTLREELRVKAIRAISSGPPADRPKIIQETREAFATVH
jgi:N12 class adenine-specific DNA methylase